MIFVIFVITRTVTYGSEFFFQQFMPIAENTYEGIGGAIKKIIVKVSLQMAHPRTDIYYGVYRIMFRKY